MWDRIKARLGGRRTPTMPEAPASKASSPHLEGSQLTGDFLVYELFCDNFGVSPADVAASVPSEFRELAVEWVRIYLAWIFRSLVAERCGTGAPDVLNAVKSRLQRAKDSEVAEECKRVAELLEYWFKNLDRSATPRGTWATALVFLALDPQSPYYHKPDAQQIPDEVDMGLAAMFEAAKGQAEARMHRLIDAAMGPGRQGGSTPTMD
jgi:hypothetical protein